MAIPDSEKKKLFQIMRARDKRYDGRFYCGVHTTGIYCRPICPAKPKYENISFYRSAAEAEKEGFRPCLRCRPDLSPLSVQWEGTAAVIGRALNMISNAEMDEKQLPSFAERLGITDRHLRRLFSEHLGASPMEVIISKRLHLAKQLLLQTQLSVTDVAFAAGFQSLRRFNDAFLKKFKFSPSHFRKKSKTEDDSDLICIDIPYLAPFDWEFSFEFLRRHGIDGIESFKEGVYRREFIMNKTHGWIEVSNNPKKNQLQVKISGANILLLRTIIEKVKDLFDVRTNPYSVVSDLKGDTVGKILLKHKGIRIPGAWDSFESAVGIIMGQLVSVPHAKQKMTKLVELFGNPLFPSPEVLAKADLKKIGITKTKEHAIRELSKKIVSGEIVLSRTADISETKKKLLEIKGIGLWTAEMIAMKCLGDSNAFPKNDLVIHRLLKSGRALQHDWSPWNAYVAVSLWKESSYS